MSPHPRQLTGGAGTCLGPPNGGTLEGLDIADHRPKRTVWPVQCTVDFGRFGRRGRHTFDHNWCDRWQASTSFAVCGDVERPNRVPGPDNHYPNTTSLRAVALRHSVHTRQSGPAAAHRGPRNDFVLAKTRQLLLLLNTRQRGHRTEICPEDRLLHPDILLPQLLPQLCESHTWLTQNGLH